MDFGLGTHSVNEIAQGQISIVCFFCEICEICRMKTTTFKSNKNVYLIESKYMQHRRHHTSFEATQRTCGRAFALCWCFKNRMTEFFLLRITGWLCSRRGAARKERPVWHSDNLVLLRSVSKPVNPWPTWLSMRWRRKWNSDICVIQMEACQAN